jgi:hypothetical protein
MIIAKYKKVQIDNPNSKDKTFAELIILASEACRAYYFRI